ncbi:MAG: HAD-IA family hydrolase [Thiohalocapsa sp.]
MLFDWHGTLVNTNDAMYRAIEDMLPQLEELDLLRRMVPEDRARTEEDEKLLRYIRIFRHLHPRVLAERRVSRTDIFDALFGDNQEALAIAHGAYNRCYRRHYGDVYPFQDGIYDYLAYLKRLGIRLGIVTNRSREFFDGELALVDDGRWVALFDVTLCGDEASRYKPAPNSLQEATAALGRSPDRNVWYIGDTVSDMITARNAGLMSVFYNGGLWEENWFDHMFAETEQARYRPDLIVDSLDALLDAVENSPAAGGRPAEQAVKAQRPARLPPRQPLPPRDEPDWHPAVARLSTPSTILFDWHATLVDTLDAMYHAVDDLLPELQAMGLHEQLVSAERCRSEQDLKLLEYVRDNQKLHPKIRHDRKISRTDIFEILFGDNEDAKQQAHQRFTHHYRKYYGTALPFEPKVGDVLSGLKTIGLRLGVITNRDREFYVDELATVDGNRWAMHFDTAICGDDTVYRKPHTDQILKAAENLGILLTADLWYVGDSTTDVIAAKSAGITSVFFNGALWDQPWLNRIFPGTDDRPYKPDVVVNDFSELWALVLTCRRRKQITAQFPY